jgi:hypothetical protein
MVSQLACMLCAVDPQAASMLVPMAQASLIAAPLVFRKQLLRAAKSVRRGDPIGDDDPSTDAGDDFAEGSVEQRDPGSPVDD